MSLEIEVKRSGVPAGWHRAAFVGGERRETDYGESLLWKFRLCASEFRGWEVGRFTKPYATKKNSAGRMLGAVSNKGIAIDEKIDLDQFIGQVYDIQVTENDKGSVRVETCKMRPGETEEVEADPTYKNDDIPF